MNGMCVFCVCVCTRNAIKRGHHRPWKVILSEENLSNKFTVFLADDSFSVNGLLF